MMNSALGRGLMTAAGLVLMTAAASAAPQCTTEPKSNWLSEAVMKEKIRDMGYTFDVFKVSGNCYEIYGKNKEGKQAEVYFNPVTAAIVKKEIGKE